MRAKKYKQRTDGESFLVPHGDTHRIACCDCGLVHDMKFAAVGNGVIVTAARNNRATASRRSAAQRRANHEYKPARNE